MMPVLLIGSLAYFTGLVIAILTWGKIGKGKIFSPSKEKIFLSILIPVRDEASNIIPLLNAIAKQHFSVAQFEVIIIDDHSEDGTLEIVKENNSMMPFSLITLSLEEGLQGKKQALRKGIEYARGRVIITTDGDCVMGNNWLRSIHTWFVNHNAKMVVGAVSFHQARNTFEHLQTIEFAALIGTGAISLFRGMPNMCNGANLAFTKEAFERVGGYKDNEHLPSGDDEFLLQKIYKHYPQQVFFNAHPSGIVYTKPAKDLKTFIFQRKRWSGKWRHHKSLRIKAMAIFVFLYHLILVTSFIFVLTDLLAPWLFISVIVAKCIFEYFFLKKVLDYLGKPLYIKHFVVLQGLYSIYVLVFGVLANFGTFDWKGRKY